MHEAKKTTEANGAIREKIKKQADNTLEPFTFVCGWFPARQADVGLAGKFV
ncbi:MAG: hypothetical protein R6U66_10115 [Bacteroidales bacterium]|jgi:hypothetical protein